MKKKSFLFQWREQLKRRQLNHCLLLEREQHQQQAQIKQINER